VRLRRQGSNLPLAINSRASCQLDHAGTKAALHLGSGTRQAREAMTRAAVETYWGAGAATRS
jgi:hypothetical protein